MLTGLSRSALTMAFLLATAMGIGGCAPLKFVVEARPSSGDLRETVVLRDDDAGWLSEKVALIDLSGVIVNANQPGLLAPGENPVGRFVESLQRAADDRRVRAVVIRINSPGGTVTASDIVYREIQRFRDETGKPVVVLMADAATSGGYYVACAADEVIAHPTTVTGSIGVIIQTFNFSGGLKRIGIRADAITSGPNKAMGSPWEPMPDEHRALFQGLVDEFYMGFIDVVKTRRPNLTDDDLARVTDGRVVTGREAAEVGLVDRLGDLHVAFARAKARGGIEAARLVQYHRHLEYVGSPYTHASDTGRGRVLQVNIDAPLGPSSVAFYYLWDPTVW